MVPCASVSCGTVWRVALKYAEGLPGARYYGGNEIVDQVRHYSSLRARLIR